MDLNALIPGFEDFLEVTINNNFKLPPDEDSKINAAIRKQAKEIGLEEGAPIEDDSISHTHEQQDLIGEGLPVETHEDPGNIH